MKLTAKAPENRPGPKRKFIFEPSIFRCELLVSWRVEQLNDPVVPDELVVATVGKRRISGIPTFPTKKSHLFHRSFVHFEVASLPQGTVDRRRFAETRALLWLKRPQNFSRGVGEKDSPEQWAQNLWLFRVYRGLYYPTYVRWKKHDIRISIKPTQYNGSRPDMESGSHVQVYASTQMLSLACKATAELLDAWCWQTWYGWSKQVSVSVVVWNMLHFYPYLGNWFICHFFQLGWNHQLEVGFPDLSYIPKV